MNETTLLSESKKYYFYFILSILTLGACQSSFTRKVTIDIQPYQEVANCLLNSFCGDNIREITPEKRRNDCFDEICQQAIDKFFVSHKARFMRVGTFKNTVYFYLSKKKYWHGDMLFTHIVFFRGEITPYNSEGDQQFELLYEQVIDSHWVYRVTCMHN